MVRVLVGPLPKLLKDLVDSYLNGTEGIERLPDPASGTALRESVLSARPDVLIVGFPRDPGTHAEELLYELPRLRILGVARDASVATVSRLAPQHTRLHGVTPDQIVDEVLKAGRAERLGDGPV